METPEVAEIINKAADLIERLPHLAKGKIRDEDRCLCAFAALLSVIYERTTATPYEWEHPAVYRVAKGIEDQVQPRRYVYATVTAWNDQPWVTQQHVVETFRRIASTTPSY
jgi:hypothetical protein